MRLLSAVICNYRIHQRLPIEFQRGVTIVAGLNESGKSTLIDALHRCLFLSHRAGGEALKSMRSFHGGHPQVELTFHAEGSVWRISKTFSGSSGTARLVRESPSEQWESDEAERRLAELTGRAAATGRAAKELQRSWEHLWVRQGCALEDPLTQIDPTELETALESRLDEADRLLLASRGDRVVQLLEAAVDAEWKKNHKELRIDGEAGRLEARLRECESELERLEEARESRAAQAARLGEARKLRESAARELGRLEADSSGLAASMEELAGADEALVRAEGAVAAHAKEVADFKQLQARWREESEKLETAKAELRKHEEHEGALNEARAHCEARVESASARRATLESRRNEAEQRLELARARRDAALTRSRIAQLRTELESWAAHKGEVREAEDALARMPLIDEARIAVLEQLEDRVRSVQSRIEGSAARVQLLAGGAPMTLEGRPLEPDGLELVAKPAVLRHPDGTCVRILPGGMDLAALTDELGDLESERRRLLLESGVESASQARRLHATRASQEALLAQLRRQAGQRKDPGPELGPMQARLDALEQRSLAMEQAGVRSAPGDDPEMVASEVATIKEGAKRVDEELVALREEARDHSEEAGRRREARARVEADKDRAEGALMQLSRQLGEDGGSRSTIDDLERRAEELQGLQREAQGKSESLAALRKRRALTLDLLEKQRSLRDKAVGEIEALERDLLGDVAQDHGAQIEDKRAQRTRLKARADSARERAEADLLLKELFDEVRKNARDARLAPFAKACSEYLAIAYGASVTIGFDDTKGATTTGSIDRRAAGLDANSFGVLSHGAREFTSLAVRLALAEVLASEQADRCLPVVLDDAAANIDPERFRQVGFLLAFAASRGLQVVFATCNVDEASRLQADAVVPLRRPRLVSSAGLARAEDRHADLEAEDREAPDTASRGSVSPDRASSVGAATDAGDMESALKALRDAGGTASSRAWRAALEWDEDRFNAARELLSRRGAIEQLPGTRTWQLRGNQPHA